MSFNIWCKSHLRIVFLLSILTSQSFSMDCIPDEKSQDFERYFNAVTEYQMEQFCGQYLMRINGSLDYEKETPQNLIKIAPSLSCFYSKIKDKNYSYLEVLFYINLGWVAEYICQAIHNNGETLPETDGFLLKIHQGENLEINLNTWSHDFIESAYRVANQSINIPMVQKLFRLTGVLEKIEFIKKEHPIPCINYIHEPYWSYHSGQLQAYGTRIIHKISPYFVDLNSVLITEGGKFVLSQDEKIKVRKVPFGYVLPNLYLKKRIADSNDTYHGVARLFIVPKTEHIKFTFKLPQAKNVWEMENKRLDYGDSGDNPQEVLTEDFDVYQEWIAGSGQFGSESFAIYGHRDFRRTQIIRCSKDHKEYLIDTKERKNFFGPIFSPFSDDYTLFRFDYEKQGIKDAQTYKSWKGKNHAGIFDAKSLNFDPRVMLIDITVPFNEKIGELTHVDSSDLLI